MNMNVKSKFDDSDTVKEPKKKYYFLGYSNSAYRGGGERRGFGGNSGTAVLDLHMFDILLEKLGIKKKVRRRSEGDE